MCALSSGAWNKQPERREEKNNMSNENINKEIRAQLTVSLITDTYRMFHFHVYTVYRIPCTWSAQRWGDNPLGNFITLR